MNCINHQNDAAVCQCVICHKGLCNDCYHEVDSLCACSSGTCDDSAKIYRVAFNTHSKVKQSKIFYLIAGVSFLSWGLMDILDNKVEIFTFGVIALGMTFLIQGFPSIKKTNDSPSENWGR